MREPAKLLAFISPEESGIHDYRHACPQQFPGQIMETGEGSLCGFRAV
jgi:hypothetical protein